MPEGPEVKISADLIEPMLKEREVIWIATYPTSRYSDHDPEGYKEFQNTLCKLDRPVYIKYVQVKGKFMYWSFNNDWYMFSTFGMSGQWSPQIGKHPCFSLTHGKTQITDKKEIYFNDPRHFGTIKFVQGKKNLLEKLNELGWDPLAYPFETYKKFIVSHLMSAKYASKTIGEVLMNQSLFAGVGNYIRAEALYEAKISPWRQCGSLNNSEIENLCNAIMHVMKDSYEHQGATILTYKDAYGAEGRYSSCFKVYGQKTDPLGNKIVKENSPEGRSIHWCPSVQV